MDQRLLNATKVTAHSVIGYDFGAVRLADILIEPPGPIDLDWFEWRRDGDGAWRLLPPAVNADAWHDDWTRRGVLPGGAAPAPVAPERCRRIPALIRATRGPHRDGLPCPRAHIEIYELLGPEGEPLLFVAGSAGELSDDHLAYYELLYDDSGPEPLLRDRRHWRFDVAGMEGLEFVAITMGLSTVVLILVLPPAAIVILYLWLTARRRAGHGRCPKCGYDLSGIGEPGCPECGWARPAAAGPIAPSTP